MINDFTHILNSSYEKKKFSLTLPKDLDFLRDIEKVASNTLQPLRIFYQQNITTSSIGVIFLNKSNDKEALHKAMNARKLLKQVLNFQKVILYRSLGKH